MESMWFDKVHLNASKKVIKIILVIELERFFSEDLFALFEQGCSGF